MNKRITIKDVAAAVGVHYSTVSLALRDHPRISPDLRQAIQAEARKLGYRPDPMLSALNAYRTGRFGRGGLSVLAYLTGESERNADLGRYTHRSYWEGALARSSQLGYSLERFWLGDPAYSEERWSQILYTRGIRGLLVACFPGDQPALNLDWGKFCAVRISQSPHEPPLHTISHNQMQVVRLAMHTVRARGFRRPGLVLYPLSDERSSQLWSAGYLVEQHLMPPEDRVPALQNAWTREALAQWLREWRPDVVMCNVGFLMVWMRELGLKIPDEIGFVDLNLEGTRTGVTGVYQNHHSLAATAIDRIASLIHTDSRGVPDQPDLTLISGVWMDGGTLRGEPARRRRLDRATA